MARRPFFSGNYGSALGSTAQAADIIARAGQQRGQALANMGAQIGGMIQQYGLNKQKRAELTDEIESAIKFNPEYLSRMTSTGDEASDKKAQTRIEKLSKGDLNMSELKGLAGDLAMMEKVDLRKQQADLSSLNKKLLEEKLYTSQQTRAIEKELNNSKKQLKESKDKAYESIDVQIDQIEQDILDGMSYEDLPSYSKSLLANRDLIRNRQIPIEDLVYNPREELDDKTARLNFQILQGEKKKQDADIKKTGAETASILQDTKDAKAEASIVPEFTDKASAQKSIDDLPQGVSASIKKFKNGFNVELQYKAKEFTDIPSVPGFPNYKIVGGYVYEGDPKTKKLTKLGSENFGEKSELLQKTIQALTTKDVEQYGLAKFRGKQNEDNDYQLEDPASRETIVIPFNQDLENRLIYLDELENKLKTQIDLDLRTKR